MKKILLFVFSLFSICIAQAQLKLLTDFRLEPGLSAFSKYKKGIPLNAISGAYPYLEYNDVNALTSYLKVELGLLYIPYGKKSGFGFKAALIASQGKIKHAFLTNNNRTFKTNILSYGIKLYPFANNGGYAIGVSSNDTEEGKKYYGSFLSGFFIEFGGTFTTSSFERLNYASNQYEVVKSKVRIFQWGESLAVFSGKRTTLGLEISACRYNYILVGGNQGKKQINTMHAGIWASFKLH
jgi:hypothetical protein